MTTTTEVTPYTIKTALKYLYRATPVGVDEQRELFRTIERLEAAIAKPKK